MIIMIRYLIKNNLKLMLRNKWIIIVMVLGPILVVSILSSAFGDIMKSYEKVDKFSAGYRLTNADYIKDNIVVLKEEAKKAGIELIEYTEGDPENIVMNNGLAGFVEFEADRYTLYESDDHKIEGMTLEYFINRIMDTALEEVLQSVSSKIATEKNIITVEQLDFMPAIDAKNYYGIAYIVYFIWCGIVCIAGILTSEKKNGIEKKYEITRLSNFKLFCAKLIPAVLTIVLEMIVTIFAITLIFDMQWGNIPMTILVLLLTVVASTAVSLMVYYLFQNLAVTIIIIFTVVWIMGFIGGCFETYMFSSWSESLKCMSPLYHINRTLVEYSCMGKSSYTVSCIIFLLILTAAGTAGALIINKCRKKVSR